MSTEALLALAAFALVTSITPGPSNLMLLASGANFGFRRTVPQLLGITAGFAGLLLACGLGLGALLTAMPVLHAGLQIVGAAYLLYLAWRIGTARATGGPGKVATPISFLQSAAFQWINPKAWVVALTVMAVHADPAAPFRSTLPVCIVFALVNLPAVSVWAGFGVGLRGFLTGGGRLRWFNIAMGLALAATLWPMLRG